MTYTSPIPQELSSDDSALLIKHRKRMRGIATLFIVLGVIGAWAGIVAMMGMLPTKPAIGGLDILMSGITLFVSGFMARNGSRAGAVFILFWVFLGLYDIEYSHSLMLIGILIRTALYFSVACVMVWSAFKYHQLIARGGLALDGNPIIRWAGKTILALVIAIVAFGLWVIEYGISTKIVSGSDIPDDQIAWMKTNEILLENETPLLFYSAGISSIATDGNLLTNRYVGGWWEEDGTRQEKWFRHGEVCDIELTSAGNTFSDAMYTFSGVGAGNAVSLLLSVEDGHHLDFVRRTKYLNDKNMNARFKTICDSGEEIDWNDFARSNGIPEGVVIGESVTDEHREWLIEKEYLLEDEEIHLFYSHGKYHIDGGGSLLTNLYFGGWFDQNFEKVSLWHELGQMCSIGKVSEDNETHIGVYKATFTEDRWYQFWLPTQGGQDEMFIAALNQANSDAAANEDVEACQSNDTVLPSDEEAETPPEL